MGSEKCFLNLKINKLQSLIISYREESEYRKNFLNFGFIIWGVLVKRFYSVKCSFKKG